MPIRMTQQTKLVLKIINNMGHATNGQILSEAEKSMPGISATTVHRITNRLISNGYLCKGPQINNVTIIDSNTKKHDHFVCYKCSAIKDIVLPSSIRESLNKQVTGFESTAQLTISGDCIKCLK